MKTIIASITLAAVTSLAATNTYQISVKLTSEQVDKIKTAQKLEGKTNISTVAYAGEIATTALVKKAGEVEKRRLSAVVDSWPLLSDAEKLEMSQKAAEKGK